MVVGTIAAMLAGLAMLYVCSTITEENVNKALDKQSRAIRA